MGKSNLKEKCLDVIAKLKDDADELLNENQLSEAVSEYRDQYFTDKGKEQIKDNVIEVMNKLKVDT